MHNLYEALAEAFLAEGVDTQFVLMGDGNMHWSTAFAKLPGVETVHVRHEHATVAAATAYNNATGKVAVASVTCGPGVTQLMTALPAAKRPIVLGGRGVMWSGARDAVIKLADRCGALLSNTLPARGLFHDHPFGLGITGSYFTALGREMYESADVVLAVGTSLSYYVGGGHFWPKAYKIQLDDAPRGLRDGLKAADLYVKSDALIGTEAILAGLDKKQIGRASCR